MASLKKAGTFIFVSYLQHVTMAYMVLCEILRLPKRGNGMKLITLYLPEPYIKALDQLVNERFYPNRAEAIRVAIHDMINIEIWQRKRAD